MAAAKAETVESRSFNAPPINPILYSIEDSESWNASLKSEGYAVIHNFLPDEDRQKLLETFYDDFFGAAQQSDDLNLRKMDRANKETWMSPDQLGRKSRHAPLHIAQSDFMWGLRSHPHIREVYSIVHNVETTELVTSLDSYSLHMRGHPSEGLVLHDDQAWGLDDRSEHYSIQGAYNFYSCSADDSGLIVVPKSHQKWHKRRAGTVGSRHKRHFIPVSSDEEDYEKYHSNARKLILPKNCFVIWNSKLLHGTCVGTRERRNEEPSSSGLELPRVNRLTCFVSMAPKALRSDEALANKIHIYKLGGTTSHWSTHAEAHVLNEAGPIGGYLDANGSIPTNRLPLL